MKSMMTHTLTLAALLLAGCTAGPFAQSEQDVLSQLSPAYYGSWVSDGYGYAVMLSPRNLDIYNVTDTLCVKSDAGPVLLNYINKGGLTFKDNNTLEFRTALEDYPITLRRAPDLPLVCTSIMPNTPQGNLDAFASFFKQHYAFFDLYGVNWDRETHKARRLVTPQTSDSELFAILQNLLTPIKDGHVSLSAKIGGKDEIFKPRRSTITQARHDYAAAQNMSRKEARKAFRKAYWRDGIGGSVLGGEGTLTGSGFIQYGITSEDIGYISLLTMAGYARQELYQEEEDLAALHHIMDDALTEFKNQNVKAVLLDLSMNMGGYDFLGRAIAGRFAESPKLVYSKLAKDSRIKTPFPVYITPHDGLRYDGPVYVLTSDATISAGETLTMALRALPQVTHLGEPTRGALSDVLEKKLPNGWALSLSNEVYYDHQGRKWESLGVPPHIPITVFDINNPLAGHLPAIKKAVKIIDKDASR